MKIRHTVNLINQISDLDKERIKNYIYSYGINESKFIGLDEWLQHWSYSNQVMYKMLGNKLIHSIDFAYEKSEEDIRVEIKNKLFAMPFKLSYHNFYVDVITPLWRAEAISGEVRTGFNHITDIENFINNKIGIGFKVKIPGKATTLQIPEGSKPMKALQKIIKYFKDDWEFEEFEEFRIAHSMILNDKNVVGKLCFSIHPLDFMTMSDNSLNWSSCMNWIDRGCYHVGTIEMMNSNNVICCYLHNEKDPFYFHRKMVRGKNTKEERKKYGSDPAYVWNNKRWRVLGYATKDIIMTGKSYPYKNQELCLAVLNEMKKLAKENLNWDYKFGPENYLDMQYINSSYSMNRARSYRIYDPIKHNILWDTKGMYNDMLNDHGTTYWCYRNKVNKTKIISVSGKANCLCCGGNILMDTYYQDEYNERFENTGSGICNSCFDGIESCYCCGVKMFMTPGYQVEIRTMEDGSARYITDYWCKECLENSLYLCPDCGRPMSIEDISSSVVRVHPDANFNEALYPDHGYWFEEAMQNPNINPNNIIQDCIRCMDCGKAHEDQLEKKTAIKLIWHSYANTEIYMFKDYDLAERYIRNNLVPFDMKNFKEGMKIERPYRIAPAKFY